MPTDGPILITLLGPTASGKTDLAESLAVWLDAQLINADTFQAYRGMDVGTAKPTNKTDYLLLDLFDPNEQAGVGEWVRRCHAELEILYKEGRSAVVVGGSGLNIRALTQEYAEIHGPADAELRRELNLQPLEYLVEELKRLDPEAHRKVDLMNKVRVTRAIERAKMPTKVDVLRLPEFDVHKFAILDKIADLEKKIVDRCTQMVENGWISEVRGLLDAGYKTDDPGFKAHGYRAMAAHINGDLTLEEALCVAVKDTRAYAKRQATWNRKEPNVNFISSRTNDERIGDVKTQLSAQRHL